MKQIDPQYRHCEKVAECLSAVSNHIDRGIALRAPNDIEKAVRPNWNGMSSRSFVQKHGRELVGAIAYTRTTRTSSFYDHAWEKKNRDRTRIALSLRSTGIIGIQVHVQFKTGLTRKTGWRSIAKLKPLPAMLPMLAEAWDELGYMVKIQKAKWVEAELAIHMLGDFMEPRR